MHPTVVEIPLWGGRTLPLHSYGLMIAIGFLFSLWIARREFRRRKLPDVVNDLGLLTLLCGLLGGRLFYYVQFYSERFSEASFLEFFAIWRGGLVFYGGAAGGLLGAAIFAWRKKLPIADCLDVVAVGAPVAMAFGRLGCFLNGCCYGALCDPSSPLGVVFPYRSPAQSDQWRRGFLDTEVSSALAVHPVQLYQAAHDLLLAGLLLWYVRRGGSIRGGALPLGLLLYGAGRFVIECFRGDNLPTWTGLTISQDVAVGTMIVGLAALMALAFGRRSRSEQPGASTI